MDFADSWLGRLRAEVGHQLLLCPGAQVVVQRPDGWILLQRRTDSGVWEIPAGSAEPGQSFVACAVTELREETGIIAGPGDLMAFASLSDPALHTLRYPNGDVVHAFALCFLLRCDRTPALRPDDMDGEAVAHAWFPRDALPHPLHPPTQEVLELLTEWERDGRFRAR